MLKPTGALVGAAVGAVGAGVVIAVGTSLWHAAWHAGVAAGWLLGKSATHLGAGARRGAALSSGARAACNLRAHRGAHDARDLREAVARELGGRVGAPQLLLHLLAAREAWVGLGLGLGLGL